MQVGGRVTFVVRLDLDGALRVVVVLHLAAGGVLRVDRGAARHRGTAMARSAGTVNRYNAVTRRTEQARGLIDGGADVTHVPCDIGDIAGLRGDGADFRRVRLSGARCRVHHVDQGVELGRCRGQVLLKDIGARQRRPVRTCDADAGHVARVGLPGHFDVDRAGKGRATLRVRRGSGRHGHDAVAHRGQDAAGRDGGDRGVGHRPADIALVRHARAVVPPGHVVEPQRAALRGDALGDGRAGAGSNADRGAQLMRPDGHVGDVGLLRGLGRRCRGCGGRSAGRARPARRARPRIGAECIRCGHQPRNQRKAQQHRRQAPKPLIL